MTLPTNYGLIPPPKASKPSVARNEQLKLIAAYLNGIAIALITVGILAPTFAYLYSAADTPVPIGELTPAFVICALGSFVLHLVAVTVLRGIRP